jgi:hypothetical protein
MPLTVSAAATYTSEVQSYKISNGLSRNYFFKDDILAKFNALKLGGEDMILRAYKIFMDLPVLSQIFVVSSLAVAEAWWIAPKFMSIFFSKLTKHERKAISLTFHLCIVSFRSTSFIDEHASILKRWTCSYRTIWRVELLIFLCIIRFDLLYWNTDVL